MAEKRILIVDDEIEAVETVRLGLELKGYVVSVQTDSITAGEEIKKRIATGYPYDLLLIDIEMPKMRGDELLKKLRLEGVALPPVIIMSGYHDTDHLDETEFNDFINKPMTMGILEERIRKILG